MKRLVFRTRNKERAQERSKVDQAREKDIQREKDLQKERGQCNREQRQRDSVCRSPPSRSSTPPSIFPIGRKEAVKRSCQYRSPSQEGGRKSRTDEELITELF